MPHTEDYLVNACRFGLILDTNTLMLWLAGREPDGFRKCPRVRKIFLREHFDFIDICVGYARGLVITPAILTEMSNLMIQDKNAYGKIWAEAIQQFLEPSETSVSENIVESALVVKESIFRVVGYADTTIALAAEQTGASVISVDGMLVDRLQKTGLVAHNLWWEFPNYTP